MKHKNMCYDNRYKYKLNMLEPGLIMTKIIGVLFVTGILFWELVEKALDYDEKRWMAIKFLCFTILFLKEKVSFWSRV